MINRDNYEAYFLDFVEGKLSTQEEEVLGRFLKFNPDLDQELKGFELIRLKGQEISFGGKEALKKELPGENLEITEANFEMYCVAYLEADLSRQQRDNFLKYLDENPEKNRDLDLFRKTRLVPEPMAYPNRANLKRRPRRSGLMRYMVPTLAAAAIALMVFFGPLANQEQVPVVAEEISATEQPRVEGGSGSAINDEKGEQNSAPENQQSLDANTTNTGSSTNRANTTSPTRSTSPPSTNNTDNRQRPTESQGVILESAGMGSANSIRLIRQSGARKVPTTKMEAESAEANAGKGTTAPTTDRVRFASLDLQSGVSKELNAPSDRLELRPVGPITVDPGSFTAQELARYRINQINQVVEDDAIIWNLASRGIEELNKRVGTEGRLIASTEEDGSVSGIHFRSRFLNVSTPLPDVDP